MTNEEVIVCLKIMFSFWANTHELNVSEMEEAKDIAIRALTQSQPDKPLTLEELRGMDGECVKVVVEGIEPLKMLALVEIPENEDCVLLRNNLGGVSEFYSDDDLRDDGVKAYPYHPDRIDRDAWVCELCKGATCVSGVAYAEGRADDGHEFSTIFSDDGMRCDFRYCPNCGRPLTPEAWDELEKRVRG